MSDHETLIAVAARWEALYNDARDAHCKAIDEITTLVFDAVERDTLIAALRAEAESNLLSAQWWMEQSDAWEQRYDKAEAQIAALKAATLPREILERLDQKFEGDCYVDHDGFCQQHTFGDPCVMPAIRAVLAAVGIPATELTGDA